MDQRRPKLEMSAYVVRGVALIDADAESLHAEYRKSPSQQ